MKEINSIKNELNGLNITIPVGLATPMEFPLNYFENLENAVFDKIKTTTFIEKLPKNTPLSIPSAYFNGFEETILQKIKQDDFIDSLPKAMPFELPMNYFETSEQEIKEKLQIGKPVLQPLRVQKSRYKMLAIAATVVLFLGIAFSILPPNTMNVEQQLATISQTEIEAYIQQHQTEFSTDIATTPIDENNIDVKQLENEILEKQLNNVSEEELKQYL